MKSLYNTQSFETWNSTPFVSFWYDEGENKNILTGNDIYVEIISYKKHSEKTASRKNMLQLNTIVLAQVFMTKFKNNQVNWVFYSINFLNCLCYTFKIQLSTCKITKMYLLTRCIYFNNDISPRWHDVVQSYHKCDSIIYWCIHTDFE